jgi:phage terminase large subunit-like protein
MKDLYLSWKENPEGKTRYVVIPTKDNAANIDPEFLNDIEDKYKNTRLYRQEILGEILWESDEALFTTETLDTYRITEKELPELSQIVVAIDPAVTNTKTSDDTAITVCGIDEEGHGYILYSTAMKSSPNVWAQKAITLYDHYNADYIVCEVNNGGDLIRTTLEQARKNIPIKDVRAAKNKIARMEPISLLAEQGKVHLVGVHSNLEDQMVGYAGKGPSPNEYDSACWGLSCLMLGKTHRVTSQQFLL